MTQMNENETSLAVVGDSYSPQELTARIHARGQELEVLQQFFQSVMVKDQDYGIIPGTAKPTLLKPGAEKLAELYGYAPIVKEPIAETVDTETGFYRARVTVQLVSKRTGVIMAEGVGEANTKEGRYRWRNAERTCPSCGASAIIKGKAEYGGGWVCFTKKGGCNAKFRDDDVSITGQPQGRIENDDPFTLWNTVLKMAKKRGLVDAVLSSTRSSGLFTQDVEDFDGWVAAEVVLPAVVREEPHQAPVSASAGPNGESGAPASAATPAAPSSAIDQIGVYKRPDGGINSLAFSGALTRAGMTPKDLVGLAPPNANGNGIDLQAYLRENPTKTLTGLLGDAKERKEAVPV